MSEYTEAREIGRLAQAALELQVLPQTDLTVHLVPPQEGGAAKLVDAEAFLDQPRRQRGTSDLYDEHSFTEFTKARRLLGTTLWADWRDGLMVAVFNDYDPANGLPGWADFRAQLVIRATPEWERWKGINGRWLSQVDLASHIERSLEDFVEPTGADMLELALSLEAHQTAQYRSAHTLQSGTRRFTYEEEVTAHGGAKGTMDIPTKVSLQLAPWEGADPWRLEANFKYRLKEGELTLQIEMLRFEEARQEAFTELTARVAVATELTVFAGRAPQPVKPGPVWQ